MRTKLSALQIIFVSIILTFARISFANLQCSDALLNSPAGFLGWVSAEDRGVRVNRIAVTGARQHSNEEILQNLGLNENTILRWWELKSKIISVGEGTSNLVPTLTSLDMNALGVDTWYDPEITFPDNLMGREMANYLAAHSRYLVKGDALTLPFENESVDVVLSHYLVNNLHVADVLDFISEAIRVLKVGGEARIFYLSPKRPELLVLLWKIISQVRSLIFL